MLTIYKYPLFMVDEQTLALPLGAKILSFHNQKMQGKETPCIWVLLNNEEKRIQEVKIFLIRTGNPIDKYSWILTNFIGTALFYGDKSVLHAFWNWT